MQLEGNEGYFGLPRGTYAYMAPEQFDGMFTKEGDQYSLGCIAYELLTGRHPFECFYPFNPYDRRIMQETHKNTKARALRELNNAIPYHIEQAILQSMAKKSSERHINIAAFIRSLQPSTDILSHSAYHFTPPLETPQPFTSTAEEIVSPINPPNNPDASSIGVEVYELIQPKLSFIQALQKSRNRNSVWQKHYLKTYMMRKKHMVQKELVKNQKTQKLTILFLHTWLKSLRNQEATRLRL